MASKTTQLGADTIEIYKGESKTLLLTVLDENRDPQDLTGATLTMTVRKRITDTATVITKVSTTVTEIEIQAPATGGLAKIFLTPADTSSLAPGDYVYDIWTELASGRKSPVIKPSQFVILLAVTTFP